MSQDSFYVFLPFVADVYAGFVRVITELVGDAGERLVYRAHMYARADILGYKPAPGDLAYPQKLIMMESITRSTAAAVATTIEATGSSSGSEPKENLKRQTSVNSIVSATSQEVALLTSNQRELKDTVYIWVKK